MKQSRGLSSRSGNGQVALTVLCEGSGFPGTGCSVATFVLGAGHAGSTGLCGKAHLHVALPVPYSAVLWRGPVSERKRFPKDRVAPSM